MHAMPTGEEARVEDLQKLDAEVKAHAIRRAALDAREAELLREVDETHLWKWLGFVNIAAYVEDRFGIGVHAAMERVRVARELAELPRITAALEAGDITYGHARELTRTATPATEARWLAEVEGSSVQRTQRAVSGRGKGDLPDAPPRPDLTRVKAWFEVRPETRARIRTTRAAAEAMCGGKLDDDAFLELILRSFEERSGQNDATNTRPAYQVAITTCRECKRSTQNGRGMEVDIRPAALERALCDAEHIGDPHARAADDVAVADTIAAPPRRTSTVTPRIRREVFARDSYRCVVPGCRSTRNLDIHHLRFQVHGGGHEKENLCTACGAHHAAVHDGILSITGRAPDLVFTFHNESCDLDLDGTCECEPESPRPLGDEMEATSDAA